MAETATQTPDPSEAPTASLPGFETVAESVFGEAPTAEHALPGANTDPNVAINPDQDTFSQLQKDAAERGRPDMVGLEWRDQDGMRYRVSSYDIITRNRAEPKKTGLPRLALRNSIEWGPALERKETYVSKQERVESRTIDVYNTEGDLVDILSFTGKERRPIVRKRRFEGVWEKRIEKLRRVPQYEEVDRFAEHFYVSTCANPNAQGAHIKVPRKITDVRWTDQQQEEAEPGSQYTYESVLVPLDKDSKVSFYLIAAQQERLGLDSWRGLTWRDQAGNQKQIIRDEVIRKKRNRFSNEEYPERVFEVRTQDRRNATLQRHLYTLAQLQEHFSTRDKLYPNALPVDLHWQRRRKQPLAQQSTENIPPTDPLAGWYWEEEQAWAGWGPPNKPKREFETEHGQMIMFDTEGNPTPAAQNKTGEVISTKISLDKTFMMLSHYDLYPDSHEGRAALLEEVKKLKDNLEMRKCAQKLQLILAEIGIDRFNEVVDELRDRYTTDLRRLGIQRYGEEYSASWIIKDLVGQRVNKVGNPFSMTPEGRQLRRQVLNLRLGQRFKEAATTDVKKQVRDWDKDNPDKPIERTIHAYGENAEVTAKLRALLYGEGIKELIKRQRTSDDPDLTPSELISVGHMIELSLGRN